MGMSRFKFRRKVAQQQAGQAMVEFALVIFFVFILFVSALQMILLMHAYNTLADAAKEGVRYAIVRGSGNSLCSGPGNPNANPVVTCTDATGANVQTTVVNFAALSFQNVRTSEVTVDYDPNSANSAPGAFGAACSAPGCLVRVTVAHTYSPFFGLRWPNFTLRAAADGRIMN
jgi:Flp pilus assembly protein TadG